MANILFFIRTNEPSEVERHLVESLSVDVWEWFVELYPTSAQVVHDSMEASDSDEPNWHSITTR